MLLGKRSRGVLVQRVQTALGLDADGIYGTLTSDAVKKAQALHGFQQTGDIENVDQWRKIVRSEPPSLFERCLGLTAQFEGHNYTLAAGNWDGAGVTWGIIGFNLKSNSLSEVLRRIPIPVLRDHFGKESADELLQVTTLPLTSRIAWGDSVSDASKKKTRLVPRWAQGFDALGRTQEAQLAQQEVAAENYWAPSQKHLRARASWLKSERAAAMWFDCWVQQGRVYDTAISAAKAAAPEGELAVLVAVAKAQASGNYATDILARRIAIASGFGAVHGREYRLAAYGILGPTQ